MKNLEISNPLNYRQSLIPSKIQNTFNKPKVLTHLHPNLQRQLESLILITNPNLQSFHIHILITNPNLSKFTNTIGIFQK